MLPESSESEIRALCVICIVCVYKCQRVFELRYFIFRHIFAMPFDRIWYAKKCLRSARIFDPSIRVTSIAIDPGPRS